MKNKKRKGQDVEIEVVYAKKYVKVKTPPHEYWCRLEAFFFALTGELIWSHGDDEYSVEGYLSDAEIELLEAYITKLKEGYGD